MRLPSSTALSPMPLVSPFLSPSLPVEGGGRPRRARGFRGMAALLALLALSCGPAPRDPHEIEFWTLQLSPTFDAYMNGLVAAYERAHPGLRVKWVDVPYEGITQKFLNAIAAGRSPDVVNLPADYVLKYARLGALTPLDGLLPDSTRAAYLPAAVRRSW